MNGWYGRAASVQFSKRDSADFDKHCVSCHDYGKKAGEKLNLAVTADAVFCTSYVISGRWARLPAWAGRPAEIRQPLVGESPLQADPEKSGRGHAKVVLTPEELIG
jgi:mono/diheme cytochrome c family protein